MQFDEVTDKRLEALAATIAAAEAQIKEGTDAKDAAWAETFQIFEAQLGPDEGGRFLASDDHTISKQKNNVQSTIKQDQLLAGIQRYAEEQNWTKQQHTMLINAITEQGPRVLSQDKLSTVMKRRPYLNAIVAAAMSGGGFTFSRVRRKTSKEDKTWLADRAKQQKAVEKAVAATKDAAVTTAEPKPKGKKAGGLRDLVAG